MKTLIGAIFVVLVMTSSATAASFTAALTDEQASVLQAQTDKYNERDNRRPAIAPSAFFQLAVEGLLNEWGHQQDQAAMHKPLKEMTPHEQRRACKRLGVECPK